jgi:hypothetical protein
MQINRRRTEEEEKKNNNNQQERKTKLESTNKNILYKINFNLIQSFEQRKKKQMIEQNIEYTINVFK